MTDLIRNTFTGSVDQQITDKLITNMLDSPEFPFSFVLNWMCPVLDGTGVMVGLLAASVLTANSGAFFLAFLAFLWGQKCLLFLILSVQNNIGCHWVEVSLGFTSFLPRFTSFFTSSTEKPNRSSYSGELLQTMPEEYSWEKERWGGGSIF